MISDSHGASGDCMAFQIYASDRSSQCIQSRSRGPSSKPTAKSAGEADHPSLMILIFEKHLGAWPQLQDLE